MHPIGLPTPSNSRPLLPASAAYCGSPNTLDSSDAVSTKSSSSTVPGMRKASSPEELGALLQHTYAAIRAKEKDIRLAAQVGRALLENNLELKAKQESVKLQMRARHRSSALLQAPDSPELVIRPSTSILTRTYDTHATASRILERVNSADSQGSSSRTEMRLISRDQADQAIAEMLAQKNSETEHLLASTLAQQSATREADMEKHLKLENEMMQLQCQLELAAQTIENLENQKQQYQQDVLTITEIKDATAIDQEMLAARLNHLQAEHERLLAGNDAAQHRLGQALKSLSLWQNQIADLETINEMYKDQQTAYDHQLTEISRLSGAIEEYKTVVADFQDRPDKSTLSDYGDSDIAVLRANRQMASPVMVPSKSNLFSELERAWATTIEPTPLKDSPNRYSPGPSSAFDASADLTHPSPAPPSHTSSSRMLRPLTFRPPALASTTSSIDPRPAPSAPFSSNTSPLGDLPQSLYANLSVCYNKTTSPDPSASWVSERLVTAVPRPSIEKHILAIHLPLQIAYKLWAWYRFSLIIFLAIVINLWRGPDAVLEK